MTKTTDEKKAHCKNSRKRGIKKGLVIVNTGKGKGKTTASIGLITRAWGRDMRVGMIQFLKNENARFGELRAMEKMGVDVLTTGKGWTWKNDEDEAKQLAVEAWRKASEIIKDGEYQLLVLDEFTYPLAYDWIDLDQVIDWIKEHKPEMMHLVITGRHAPEKLIQFADLVTEMRSIKHPLQEGIRAQPGIEF
jgi:cob(I)alamin adenosyltransferase